jgi:glycolate oxidase
MGATRDRVDRAATNERQAWIASHIHRVAPDATVISDRERLTPFETDAYIGYRVLPLIVVLPGNEADCKAIVGFARETQIPIVARGAGTGISGGSIPDANGILLVTTRMRAMVALDGLARVARVQPGHRNLAVSEAARPLGLFYAPDPSSQVIASIGGNLAANAGGIHCLKYGLTTHNVRGARLITGDAERITLGSQALDVAGYDLLALVIGSEGNLGIVTEATLNLLPLPESTVTLLAAFATVDAAAAAVGAIIGGNTELDRPGVIPAALEMMDALVIEVCERFMNAGFPRDCAALLLCELDGDPITVADECQRVQDALAEFKPTQIRLAREANERETLWKARKGAFTMLAAIHPDYYTIDGTIPRAALPTILARIAKLADAYGLVVANVFHAGDGNIHPCIFYDATRAGEQERSEELAGHILEACIEVGGTITGEHGVGIEKLRQMCQQFRPHEIAAFHAVKAAFDPDGLMNPGKAVPTLNRCAEWGGLKVRDGVIPHAEIPRF